MDAASPYHKVTTAMDRYLPSHSRRTTRAFLLVGICLLGIATPCQAKEAQPPACKLGVLIELRGEIGPMLEQFLYRRLDKAKSLGADLIILEIESPGGYLHTSENIAKRLRDLDWAHTVAYVPDYAYSGAAIAALGCDEIIMEPRALIGDAGPIIQDENFQFQHAPEKILSPLRQIVRGLAEAKGRPPAVAEAMVDRNLKVFHVTNRITKEETFMSEEDIESQENPDDWEKGKQIPESGDGDFLTVDGDQAVAIQLAEGTASSREELKERYQLEKELIVLRKTGVDTAVAVLNWPLVTGLLFVIGLIALYVEFSAPGIGVGGLTAGLCFTLFFWSRFMGGTAEWLELILFFAGLVFLAVELFVLPGFGVAGLTGALLLLASIVMASVHFTIPSTPLEKSTLAATLMVVMVSGSLFAVSAMVISRRLPSIPLLSQLALIPTPETTGSLPDPRDEEGADNSGTGHFRPRIGDVAVADSALRPAGRARFADRFVDVVTEGTFVSKGQRIRVIEVYGNRIVVDLESPE